MRKNEYNVTLFNNDKEYFERHNIIFIFSPNYLCFPEKMLYNKKIYLSFN